MRISTAPVTSIVTELSTTWPSAARWIRLLYESPFTDIHNSGAVALSVRAGRIIDGTRKKPAESARSFVPLSI